MSAAAWMPGPWAMVSNGARERWQIRHTGQREMSNLLILSRLDASNPTLTAPAAGLLL